MHLTILIRNVGKVGPIDPKYFISRNRIKFENILPHYTYTEQWNKLDIFAMLVCPTVSVLFSGTTTANRSVEFSFSHLHHNSELRWWPGWQSLLLMCQSQTPCWHSYVGVFTCFLWLLSWLLHKRRGRLSLSQKLKHWNFCLRRANDISSRCYFKLSSCPNFNQSLSASLPLMTIVQAN